MTLAAIIGIVSLVYQADTITKDTIHAIQWSKKHIVKPAARGTVKVAKGTASVVTKGKVN